MASLSSNTISSPFRNPRIVSTKSRYPHVVVVSNPASSFDSSSKTTLRISADSSPKARFVARRTVSLSVHQLQRPLIEYMSLPASQYSVLDAERIERVDENTFRCYVYRFKFFAFEVCPVLLVSVEEQPHGCCIKLLSCKLEGSPIVVAQNDKFDVLSMEDWGRLKFSHNLHPSQIGHVGQAIFRHNIRHCHNLITLLESPLTLIWYGHAASMENKISCDSTRANSAVQKLTSDAVIEVSIEVPFAFRAIPAQAIQSAGSQVLDEILKAMLPRFVSQLVKDYEAWASGDASRQPLGTGEI